jgi:peptidyl-prolyl cis-trans isomerase D
MITWMQKKKNYLIVTIWISTIAFLGAGFVGWGEYSFGSKSNKVASVGSVDVKISELQRTYSNMFGYYQKMFDGKFDKEMAKQFKLEQQSINLLVNQALMVNLANEFDLTISDKELWEEISTMEAFFNEERFDSTKYKNTLRSMQIKPIEFEATIKKELLIKKVSEFIKPSTTELELQTVEKSLNVADKINYLVLDQNDINLTVDEEKLKNFWEAKKAKYKTPTMYKIDILHYPAFNGDVNQSELLEYYTKHRFDFQADDGTIPDFKDLEQEVEKSIRLYKNKKNALKEYIAYKKASSESNVSHHTINENDTLIHPSILKDIISLEKNKILKPRINNGEYIIVKKLDTIMPRVKTYNEAKEEASIEYTNIESKHQLEEKAYNMLSNFKGKETPFISKKSAYTLDGLSEDESAIFINKLFVSKKTEEIIKLDTKMILFKIVEQKLLVNETNEEIKSALFKNTTQVKQQLVDSNILTLLKNKNKINIYYKGQ